MKLAELIEKLQEVKKNHGNVDVKITDGYDGVCYAGDFYVGMFEFDDDKFPRHWYWRMQN